MEEHHLLGLFNKFEDYLKENDDRATPIELIEIVREHFKGKGIL